ncbi:MAG: GNAT family N-acetyltransferase [Thermoplasmata archaeon]
MLEVRVQRLGTGDEDDVRRCARLMDDPPDPDAARAYLGDPRNVFFVAYEGARAVGFLRGTELGQLKSGRPQMFLYEIAVEPESRRRGIGRELIRTLVRWCRERDFEEIFVFTDDPANLAAERLYQSTGGVTETVGDRMYVYRL